MDVEQKKMRPCFYSLARCLQTDSWRIVSAGDDKTLKVRILGDCKDLKFLLHIHFISSSPYCKMQCNVETLPIFPAPTTLKILLHPFYLLVSPIPLPSVQHWTKNLRLSLFLSHSKKTSVPTEGTL